MTDAAKSADEGCQMCGDESTLRSARISGNVVSLCSSGTDDPTRRVNKWLLMVDR